jgi:MscS family membrane protein
MEFLESVYAEMRSEGTWGWILQVFAVVLLTLVANFIQKRVFTKLKRGMEHTQNLWDDAVVAAAEKPVSICVWLFGLSFAVFVIGSSTGNDLMKSIVPLLTVPVLVCAMSWFLVRLVRGVETILIAPTDDPEKEPWDPTTAAAVGKLLRLSVIITALLVVLQSVGVNIAGVLAFGGIGGIAIGFASKDLLSNFFGGLMLYLDRPISVGDWIRSPDREIEGTVEDIGWRLTRIRTFDKRPLYIPNSIFNTIAIQNPSRMTHRRIYETMGLRYDDIAKVSAITDEVRSMLQAHPGIDTDQTLLVYFNAFGGSSLDFFVYCMTRTKKWGTYHEVKHEVLLKIAAIVDSHGAEFAFPTSTVHVPDGVQTAGASAG